MPACDRLPRMTKIAWRARLGHRSRHQGIDL